jgi:putative ABC transport system permease protein
MINNYLKIPWRNLSKNRSFALINLLGLALGLACSLLILLWVNDEYLVDGFHANKNRLYRIYERQYFDGKKQGVVWTQGPLAAELKKQIPEIENATAFSSGAMETFAAGDKIHKQQVNAAGPDFFQMFSFKILHGDGKTALNDVKSLAISRHMAELFFSKPDAAVGKTIRYENRMDLKVSVVFENLPENSTLKFDCLRTWEAYVTDGNDWANDWGSNDPLTFFMIGTNASSSNVEAKLNNFLDGYITDNRGKEQHTELGMQLFQDNYLYGNFKNARIDGGRIEYVKLFTAVAIFILLIACINFMNLATARSLKRAKEVGIRKVVGALRSSLMAQFVGEAILLTFFATILAVLLVAFLLPSFNGLTDKQIVLPVNKSWFWVLLIGLVFTTGLVAGSYPAFFLSSLKPIGILKGIFKFSKSAAWLRKGLVVFQFSLSVILIIGMITIYRQLNYVQTKNLGYNRDNLVYFPLEGKLSADYEVLKQQMTAVPGIKQVSHMTESPVGVNFGTGSVQWIGSDSTVFNRFAPVGVGFDFIKTMNLELIAGRDFANSFPSDSAGFLLNETAVKLTGYKNPIGQSLTYSGSRGTIIGVVKDFHFQSLHVPIRPLIVYLRNKDRFGSVLIRIEAGKTKEVLASLEAIGKGINPEFPFTYYFADESYARLYKSEQMVSRLSDCFAFIAIFISCLGLLGLAAFTAEQRTKEIGIRKVLGASVASITSLLTWNFLKLVLVAVLIASPIAWWAADKWLQNFAYRASIGWWIFLAAGTLALTIAFLTISVQAIKAAIANPIKSLRTE